MKSMSLSVAHVRSSDASTIVPSLSRATQPPRCSMRSMAWATAGESACRRDCAAAPLENPATSTSTRTDATRDTRVLFSFFDLRFSILLCPSPCARSVEAPVDLGLRQRLLHAVESLLGELCVVQVEIFQIF